MAGRSARWTDEVTRCIYSGFGNQQAQTYTQEGFRQCDHEFLGNCLYLRYYFYINKRYKHVLN